MNEENLSRHRGLLNYDPDFWPLGKWFFGKPDFKTNILDFKLSAYLSVFELALSAVAGEVVPPKEGQKIIKAGVERVLKHPEVDPYWILAAEFSK